MIRDRYGDTWYSYQDAVELYGEDVAELTWGSLKNIAAPRVIVEEGGTPRRDPDGRMAGWDDPVPLDRWMHMDMYADEAREDLMWLDAAERAADTGEDPEEII